ncbi:MAG: radical SAM/SPASM domain-containing protein [bacterium]
MLKSINLSLSSNCGADCIFCPTDRGLRIKQKVMPFEHAEKIVNEISSKEFKKYHNITRISIGENGDAFLNKDIIEILRYIKLKIPQAKIVLFTNFQYFTKDRAEIILKEGLIHSFFCNIDGSTAKNYFYVKKLDLNNTKHNLIDFLKIRKKLNRDFPLTVFILTLHNYIHTIYNHFNFYPTKLKNRNFISIADDFTIIERQLEKILNPTRDRIRKAKIGAWAERRKIDTQKIDYKKYSCPNLYSIETEAFIAPDGTWYACCIDANNELVLGNVIEQSINKIFFSKKRRALIKLLKNKQFAKIGNPCNTVNCCLPIKKSEVIFIKIKKLLQKIKTILKLILPDFIFNIILVSFRKIKSRF